MLRVAVVAIAVVAAFLAVARPAEAAAEMDPASTEAAFVDRINDLRTQRGLARLEVHPELTALGRRWVASMAAVDRISHNPRLSTAVNSDWEKLGENVGVGPTVAKLHAAFVASPSHYRNLVDRDFSHVGVGVVTGRNGVIFTAHQFMQLRSPAPDPAPVAPVPPAATSEPASQPQPPLRVVLVLQQLQGLDPQ